MFLNILLLYYIFYQNDPRQEERSEDDSIAYTWVEFMDQVVNGTCDDQPETCYNTSCADPEVVLRMPMCKVRNISSKNMIY